VAHVTFHNTIYQQNLAWIGKLLKHTMCAKKIKKGDVV